MENKIKYLAIPKDRARVSLFNQKAYTTSVPINRYCFMYIKTNLTTKLFKEIIDIW